MIFEFKSCYFQGTLPQNGRYLNKCYPKRHKAQIKSALCFQFCSGKRNGIFLIRFLTDFRFLWLWLLLFSIMSNPESSTIRFLRLRNPECATPSGKRLCSVFIFKYVLHFCYFYLVTMAAAQQQSSPSVLAMPILTATPRRGPSRFLKVLCPISNPTPGPYVEPDEYISDSIDDEPATPFAPLQNVSFFLFFI